MERGFRGVYLLFVLFYSFVVATRRSLGELAYPCLLFVLMVLFMRPKRGIFRHLTFLLGFEGVLFLAALFNPGVPILNTPVGAITWEGVYTFFLLLGKAFLSSAMVVVISNSLGFSTLLAEMEWLRFPRVLILTLAFTYRYLDLFADEARRMRRALESRAFGLGRREYYRLLASLIGEIFVRSYRRSGRVYMAMISRGYGEFPRFENGPSITPVVALLLLLLGVVL